MRVFQKVSLGVLGLGGSTAALAQGGSMNYSPFANQVPVGSTALYMVLAILLAVVGYWALRKKSSTAYSAILVLTLALGAAGLSDLTLINQASARLASEVLLSDPQGGSVVIPSGSESFRNDSGLSQKITSLTPPACQLSNTASNACVEGRVLADNEVCNTEFICPNS